MKCPKCTFISFDYNDACPKCGKDLTHERDLMDLPAYKPKPHSLPAPLNAHRQIPGDTTRNAQIPLPKGAIDDVHEELLISLDDLSGDEPVPIQIESDPTQVEPEQRIDDEIIFDLSLPNSEEAKSKKDDLWNPEALEEKMADINSADVSEKAVDIFVREETPGEPKGEEPIVELEIEPLEFDLELEEPDEKIS